MSLLKVATRLAALATFVFILQWLPGSVTASHAQDFFLELDTGGHVAEIKKLVLAKGGAEIVSGGDDKVVRIWDRRTGKTIRTIRGHAEPGNYGKIYALAVSPDGRWLATAGWMDSSLALEPCCGDIRLFDYATGRLVALLKGHDNSVYDLAFSPDGRYLASGGADQVAIVWDVEKRAEIVRLDDQKGHRDRIIQLRFLNNARDLVTASYDGTVKLWSVEQRRLVGELTRHTAPIYAMTVSADEQRIASADAQGNIHIWRAESQAALVLARQKVSIGALAFNLDASRLVATCAFHCRENEGQIVYDVASGDRVTVYRGHDDAVRAAVVSPDGKLAMTAGGSRNEIHIWDLATGARLQALKGRGTPVSAVGISQNMERLAWGFENPCPGQASCPQTLGKLSHELGLPTSTRALEAPGPLKGSPDALMRAKTKLGQTALTLAAGGRLNRADATLRISNRRSASIISRDETNGFGHTTSSVTAGGRIVVSGGEHGQIVSYGAQDGKELRTFVGHTSMVTALATTDDGRGFATASSDQTIRLWNLETGEMIVSMLVADDGEWVIWTDGGYYQSSPNGDAMVGWQINQGPDKEARYVSAREMRERLFSPEIIRRSILRRSARRAAIELRGKDTELADLLKLDPPSFEIVSPLPRASVDAGSIEVEIRTGGAASTRTRFEIIVNNRNVTSAAAGKETSHDRVLLPTPLHKGANRILVIARNDAGFAIERQVEIDNSAQGALDSTGRLFVAAVGVDRYAGIAPMCPERNSCDLSFAVADASEFQKSLIASVASRHSGNASLLLVNGDRVKSRRDAAIDVDEPTAANITNRIEAFLAQTKPEDTTILFLAGHGANIDEHYYFLPTDAVASTPADLEKKKLVPWDALRGALQKARGHRLLFFDTCHAGRVFSADGYNAHLEKQAGDERIIALMATKANSLAEEMEGIGHGVFTYALMNGLKGAADYNRNNTIEMTELLRYTTGEVQRLTGNRQSPVFSMTGDDFVIAWP